MSTNGESPEDDVESPKEVFKSPNKIVESPKEVVKSPKKVVKPEQVRKGKTDTVKRKGRAGQARVFGLWGMAETS